MIRSRKKPATATRKKPAPAPARRKRRRVEKRPLGPTSAGLRLSLDEFDKASFEEGWHYELIHGVLVVSPPALENERDPNEELGYWLRTYKETHPEGKALDYTVYERTVRTPTNRRRADRVIWAGLGRLPRKDDTPTIIIEFVSAGKRDWERDYLEKRDEYLALGVREYWVIDRFDRTLTVFTKQGDEVKERVIRERQTYRTDLLPGFELPLGRLLGFANRWEDENPIDGPAS